MLNKKEKLKAKNQVGKWSKFVEGKQVKMSLKDIEKKMNFEKKQEKLSKERDNELVENSPIIKRLNDVKKRKYIRKMIDKYANINTFEIKNKFNRVCLRKTIMLNCIIILCTWTDKHIKTEYVRVEHDVIDYIPKIPLSKQEIENNKLEHEEILINKLIDKIIVGRKKGSYYLDEFFLDNRMKFNEDHIFSHVSNSIKPKSSLNKE